MIRITRKLGSNEPNVLRTRGSAACRTMEQLYDAGNRVFTNFDKAIYAHQDVKDALIKIQNYKCCFCESKIGHIDDGDVEHFRPKAASQQQTGTPYITPGYYWQAYRWENLFLACTKCNQRNKRNLFPLLNPVQRALSHHDAIANEQPVFIHPVDDDPETLITFDHENIKAVNANNRGAQTISILRLDRSELTQHRAELLETLTTLYLIIQDIAGVLPPENLRDTVALYKDLYNKCTAETHEYAGMFRAFFKKYPVPVV